MTMVSNSTADQSAGFLASKIQAGANISLSTANPGGDEKLQIDATVPPDTNDKVKSDATDGVTDYLDNKLLVTGGLLKSVVDFSGDHKLVLSLSGNPTTVKADTSDPSPNWLVVGGGLDEGKILAGAGISLALVTSPTPGVGNQVQINAAPPSYQDISAFCGVSPAGPYVVNTLNVYRWDDAAKKIMTIQFYVDLIFSAPYGGIAIDLPLTEPLSALPARMYFCYGLSQSATFSYIGSGVGYVDNNERRFWLNPRTDVSMPFSVDTWTLQGTLQYFHA